MAFTNSSSGISGAAGEFHTTRWSLVLSARGDAAGNAAESLETLCRLYWRPLFEFVRRRGYSPHDAQDLTQEFFSRLLSKEWLHAAEPDPGPFPSILLTAFENLL